MLFKKLVFVGLALALSSTVRPAHAQTPEINPGGVVNGASYASDGVLAPGVIFSIFGVNLTNGAEAGAPGTPLPTRLVGARVLVNGVEAPLFFASPLQINAQFPIELAGLESALIQVEVERVTGTLTSEAATAPVGPVSPGIFTYDQTGRGSGTILRNSDFSRICPEGRTDCSTNRARRGEAIAIFLTGLGQVMGPWTSGEISAEASRTVSDPVVTIGGIETPVLFSGLAAGFVGLYQVNVAVPGDSPFGDAVPLQLTLGGRTHEVTIAVGLGNSSGVLTDEGIISLVIDPSNPATLLAGTYRDGILRTTDGGRSWVAAPLPIPDEYIGALAIDPTNSALAYAGGNHGVYKSNDGGRTWTRTPAIPVSFSLAIDPADPATIYAGTNNKLFKSTDSAASWQASSSGITDQFIHALAIDRSNPAIVYAGTTGDDGTGGRVFKSTDGGATWAPAAEGLPRLTRECFGH